MSFYTHHNIPPMARKDNSYSGFGVKPRLSAKKVIEVGLKLFLYLNQT